MSYKGGSTMEYTQKDFDGDIILSVINQREPDFNKHHKQFTICDDPECLEEEQRIIEESRKKNDE
jgi:hypothetical protein